jgi:hypothetical protein
MGQFTQLLTPSSQNSFFQIGASIFKVSIANRQASNASERCGEPTATKTLISPILSLPRR